MLGVVIRSAAIYGGADFITKLFAFGAFPIIAAKLSPKEFGVLELLLTVTMVLSIFVNCGLNNSVQRFYWDQGVGDADKISIVTTGLCTQFILAIVVCIIALLGLMILYPVITVEHWPLSWLGILSSLLVMMFTQLIQFILDVLRLQFAPWSFFGLALTARVLSIGLGLVAVTYLELGIDGLLAAQALVLICLMPLALWMIKDCISFKNFTIYWFKKLTKFGHPFIYAGLAYWLFGSIDRWMLASMANVEEVGIYSVAFRFASIALFVSNAIGQAWSPLANKLRADHPEQYKVYYGNILLYIVVVMLLVGGGIALFSGEILALIMPNEYQNSAVPLAILCFGIVLQSTQQVTAIGISIERKTHIIAWLAWVAALINVICNLLLIPEFGASGAAFATFLSYTYLTCSYFYYTQKLHPIVFSSNKILLFLFIGFCIASVSSTYVAHRFEFWPAALKLIFILLLLLIFSLILPRQSIRKK